VRHEAVAHPEMKCRLSMRESACTLLIHANVDRRAVDKLSESSLTSIMRCRSWCCCVLRSQLLETGENRKQAAVIQSATTHHRHHLRLTASPPPFISSFCSAPTNHRWPSYQREYERSKRQAPFISLHLSATESISAQSPP
jgi:hypothetical protein